jgi:MGT family glycosyltransferase
MSSRLSRGGSGRKRRAVVFLSMNEYGHFQRLRPMISGLSDAGVSVHVFTHVRFKPQVERAGGLFFDLFSRYPLERADDESMPVSSRYVAFAAKYAEAIRRDVAKTGASLVINDTFAVIGRVIAPLLGVPRVNVCSGHNLPPARILPVLAKDPRVRTSRACFEAAKVLRESYGIADASPFCYVSSISPDLNIYCEPPEFLEKNDRAVFEPLAFYGSLPSGDERLEDGSRSRTWFGSGEGRDLKVYVSFGTIVWRYYADAAVRALKTIAESLGNAKGLEAIISLGGAAVDGSIVAGLVRPNVTVESYVNQWELLREARAFITHHGMNSTHEAIFHRVPMISYPFFWDQPGMAETCGKLRLAVPLSDTPRGEIGEDRVRAALARLAEDRDSMRAALLEAREWELAVMAGRPAVHRRILDLMG